MINAESIMRELENFVYREVFDEHGKKIALGCAAALFECLWLNFRKQTLYVPSADKQNSVLQERNKAIWREFNGNNHAELSIKYRLSLQQIYSITRRMRANPSGRGNRAGRPCAEAKDKPLILQVLEEYLPPELAKCGLSIEQASALADGIAGFLCQSFPGVSIRITDTLKAFREAAALPAAS
ncbi:Mor transcription activator family protein [Methylomonas sp. BW4-1]|uniref:Mor transcription activator family protein n=1 Tax=Methylomonas defluvii TaxID=3045149 RepID=A0ABU4UEZ9_9GAMM|nr:Mor transcription activator family protein [Methylomonas sp. OY6]MDX8127751.1 Mor transcription activator family protein [Methylomonas sp. OY6]